MKTFLNLGSRAGDHRKRALGVLGLPLGLALLSGVAARAGAEPPIASWDLDANPGWSITGQWAFGQPRGRYADVGCPDPYQAYTGSNVYGVNLDGSYNLEPGGPYYLTAGPIDCSAHSTVMLKFWRWLNTDAPSKASASIEVSKDGVNWTTVWSNTAAVYDCEWRACSYDISRIAARRPVVYIRWGYQIGAGAIAMTGWNIDDVRLVSPDPDRPVFRALWADVFHAGLKNTGQIDELVRCAVEGNYNAIFAQVMAYQDNIENSHGAYWDSEIVPRAIDSNGLDSLAYLIERAHANGIEVHPWLVAYRVSSGWPPAGNAFLGAHPEYIMVPKAGLGTLKRVGNSYVLDPGSPDVQEYLISIVRELAGKYAVDGIHWDYIRYETTDAGYPSDTTYANSGLERYRRITGNYAVPEYYDYQWSEFRRREVTELVRRARAEIASARGNSRQPLRHTASVIAWNDANPVWMANSAYSSCFQDWRSWMENGYLDAACPMMYFREHCADQAAYYRNWVDAAIGWRYNRHMFCGQALYHNSVENSITQLQHALNQDADGVVNYSFFATRAGETICDSADPWENDPSWYSTVSARLFTKARPAPKMPWRSPATATEGTIWGRVVNATNGLPLDNVTLQLDGGRTVATDGNGCYVATMLPAAPEGSLYNVTVAVSGEWRAHQVLLIPGDIRRSDFAFGPLQPPALSEQPANQLLCPGTTATFVATSASEEVSYQWQKDGADLVDDGHIIGATSPALRVVQVSPNDVGSYRCLVTNSLGSILSEVGLLQLKPEIAFTRQPEPVGTRVHENVVFQVVVTGPEMRACQWQKNGQNLVNAGRVAGVNTPVLTIRDVSMSELGDYRCVVSSDCGSATTSAATLSIAYSAADYDTDGDVDLEDFAELQRCLTGVGVPQGDVTCLGIQLDGDNDVDVDDMRLMVQCFSGPSIPAKIDCAN